MRPGEILCGDGPLRLNDGRQTVEVTVHNTSAHPVFISSHYPFFEVNRRLVFDRAAAWGMHLDIPAGDAVGWQPGETKTVRLVAFGGPRIIRGFNALTNGAADLEHREAGLRRAQEAGYGET